MAKTDTHVAVLEFALSEDDSSTPLACAKKMVDTLNRVHDALDKPVRLKKFYVKGRYDVTYTEAERRQGARRDCDKGRVTNDRDGGRFGRRRGTV